MLTVADIQSATASIDLTQAGWQRRSVEWFHQMQTLPIEIQQIELQILGAQRRRDQALQELNNQQRQIENATEVLDFLRDKFTATDLYLCLQKETAALYRQMYELAHRAARRGPARVQLRARPHHPAVHPRGNLGRPARRDCWPANGWNLRCATWRRRIWTKTFANTS